MGSEMCIRDRERNFLDRLVELEVFLDDLFSDQVAQFRFDERGSCLLYTSDAADERSSVDLGGRRIIKKKKHACDTRVDRCANQHKSILDGQGQRQ